MAQLVIGTRNKHKVLEIADRWQSLLAKGWSMVDLSGFPNAPEVDEDKDNFGGNAEKKACETAQALGSGYLRRIVAVSYTHLTLPTICSV